MKKIIFLFCLLFAFSQINAQIWTINSCSAELGTNVYGPMNSVATANATSRTAVIYPAAQLGTLTGLQLTNMYFKRVSTTGTMAGTPNFKIYLKEVSSADWGASALDWATAITGATLVYDSNPATIAGSSAGWKAFPLTGSFTYSGTQNLAVFTEYVNTTASTAITWSYEYTGPCISTANNNTTKYANNTTGTLAASLASANYRRPLIGFDFPVSCPAPTTLTATGITSNSVNLGWVSGGSETEWAYVVQPQGTGYPTGSGTQIFTNPYTVGSLNPSTNYEVYVRANCGVGDSSFWTGPINFTTTCVPVTAIPYLEPFATFLPSVCWFNRTGGDLTTGPTTLTGSGWVADGLGNVGTTGAVRNEIWTTGANDWFISPEITIPAGNHELKFEAAATQFGTVNNPTTAWEADDFIEVLVSTTGLTNWTPLFTYNNSNQPSNIATPNIIDLTTYAGQTIRIAFRAVEGATNGAADIDFSFDNFQVRQTPTCPDVTGLVVSNITGSTADTSWNDTSAGGAIGYEYAITTSATPPASGTATANTFYASTGLSPLTAYYLHVRSECSGSTYGAWSSVPFSTGCAPVTTLPYLEPFATFLPSVCWFNRTGGDLTTGPTSLTGSGWVADGLGNVGTTGAVRNEIWTTGANDWFISPEVTIPAVGYELKFDAAATQFGTVNVPTTAWESDDSIEILVSTTGLTNWTPLFVYNDTNQPATTASPNIIDLTAYAGQTIRIAFRAVEGATNGAADIDFSFDNFQIRQTPACSEPTAIVTANVTFSGLDMSWSAPANAPSVGYEYFVSTSNTVPVTSGTATANTFASPSGLLPNTTYYVFVRSDCGANGFSAWTGPVSFTTTCAPVTAPVLENFATFLPSVCWFNRTGGTLASGPTSLTGSGWVADGLGNVGTTGAVKNEIWTTGANDWLISPEITIPATGYELKFDAAATQFGTVNLPTNAWEADDYIEIVVTTTGLTNWTPIFTYNNSNQPANTATPNIIDLDAYAGQNIRIAFHAVEGAANGTADIDFSLDNFQVRLTPSCVEPLNLVSSGVTATTANISWDPTTPIPTTGYEYFVSTSNTVPVTAGTATTNTFAALSSLLPQTTYYIFVRSDCSAGDFSPWTGPISFTTACAPITTLPWTEGFEGLASVGTTSFPPCWFEQNGDWASAIASSYNTPHAGVNYIRDSWSATNEFVWTPGFDLVAGTSYDFSSWIQGDGYTGWTVDYFVNTAQTSTGATQVGGQYAVPGTGTIAIQPYAQVTRSFVPPTTGTYYFAFRVNQTSATPWYVAIDDLELKLSPACPTPSASATGVTDVAANLSWAAVPSATLGYEYVLDNVATDPAGSGTSIMTTTYPASGLTQLTTYYFHVRSVCSAGTYSTWSTTSFTTLATPPVNNDLCNATMLTLGTATGITQSLAAATAQTSEPVPACFNGGINGSVWFSFVAPASGSVEVTTDFAGGSLQDGDTEIAVYAATGVTCSDLTTLGTSLGCDQDGGTTVNFSSFLSLTGLVAGNTYYVQVDRWGTATAGTFGIKVSEVLGSSSFDKSNFAAYPNPVKDILNLSYNTSISNVKVVNLLGQEVLNTKTNANDVQVNMSSLAAGAYIVNITVEDTVHTIKVIKE